MAALSHASELVGVSRREVRRKRKMPSRLKCIKVLNERHFGEKETSDPWTELPYTKLFFRLISNVLVGKLSLCPAGPARVSCSIIYLLRS